MSKHVHVPVNEHRTLYTYCADCHQPISKATADGMGESKRGWRVSNTARTRMLAGMDFLRLSEKGDCE
jgi:hypothetical protein